MELKAGDTIALFEELQQDPPGTFDVMFGGGIENFEECREYLQPYRVAETDQIEEAYRVEGDAYTPFSVLPIVLYTTASWYTRWLRQRPGMSCRLIAGKGNSICGSE